MKDLKTDIVIIGAGPVGLMCAYLAQLCGLHTFILDKSDKPLQVGRADALNARTLQLLELVDLFDPLYPLGKPCNTSSVWKEGQFVSRQSQWWDEIQGCFHKHFLMLGQSYIEQLLDKKLKELSAPVIRSTSAIDIEVKQEGCFTTLESGVKIRSQYVIGADGSRSFVREHFHIPFEIIRPQIVWAVIDGVIDSDFPKVPEIIVFQSDTSEVAWIPRERNIDRFYVRMDRKAFNKKEVIQKINQAIKPHQLSFETVEWFSQFSVKESVAESYSFQNRVFLAGDACHIHSVNGGQGLNTGLTDAFNLIWKLNQVIKQKAPEGLLQTYEEERLPVAKEVIATSGELVRSTKYSTTNTHAEDYVKIVEKRAGHITGMGIHYNDSGIVGARLHDFEVFYKNKKTRIYSLLDYAKYSLLVFGEIQNKPSLPKGVQMIELDVKSSDFQSLESPYHDQAILVRPDSYIASIGSLNQINDIFEKSVLI